MLVFISGPFNSNEPQGRENNIWAARQVSIKLWNRGIPNICPHLNSGDLYGEVVEELVVEGYVRMVRYCTHMIMLEGWKKSIGSVREHKEAHAYGLTVYESLEEFDDARESENTNRG